MKNIRSPVRSLRWILCERSSQMCHCLTCLLTNVPGRSLPPVPEQPTCL
ncbi:hypothetical protein FOYG_17541 [Fusarium oxysporum NRRL 32931]|uniref:Uncharacterized protein n=1 Tax=Fusarium oxysporum NRRL 32931 TaxID=660029 RepID=W9HGH3_FUSOX|nr:hypothetical protein FOYG_17541 [Fusarium oxysporum NRRL 32931]